MLETNFGYCFFFFSSLVNPPVVDDDAISINPINFLETLKLSDVYMENQLVKCWVNMQELSDTPAAYWTLFY